MKFQMSPTSVLPIFGYSIGFLLVLNLGAVWMQYAIEDPRPLFQFFIRLFDFNQEGNIPSFFSSLLLLTASMLLFLIYHFEKRAGDHALGWLGLTLVFAFLSLDEAAQFHEFLIGFFRKNLGLSGYFYYAWIVPYGAALLLLGIVYLPFFNRLERRMFVLMMVSGGFFVAGSMGMEMFGGNAMDKEGFGLRFMVFYTIEETLEMIGVSLFIFSLLRYISSKKKKVSFKLAQSAG